MKVVYSEHYGVNIGNHPWHTSKYALVLARLFYLNLNISPNPRSICGNSSHPQAHADCFPEMFCHVTPLRTRISVANPG